MYTADEMNYACLVTKYLKKNNELSWRLLGSLAAITDNLADGCVVT